MPQLHKCAKPDCNAQCSKEFCRHHSVKYNQCKYNGCTLRCRKEYCKNHNPITMEKDRQRMTNIREMRKMSAILV